MAVDKSKSLEYNEIGRHSACGAEIGKKKSDVENSTAESLSRNPELVTSIGLVVSSFISKPFSVCRTTAANHITTHMLTLMASSSAEL